MPRVVWAEESKNRLEFEIRPRYDDVPTASRFLSDGQSSCRTHCCMLERVSCKRNLVPWLCYCASSSIFSGIQFVLGTKLWQQYILKKTSKILTWADVCNLLGWLSTVPATLCTILHWRVYWSAIGNKGTKMKFHNLYYSPDFGCDTPEALSSWKGALRI